MADTNVDVDLDALAPRPLRAKLGGKVWKLPGDMPLELYFQLQAFDQRIADGIDETTLLSEMRDALLDLLRVHQPELKELPGKTGLRTLVGALPAIYGGAEGKPQSAKRTSPQRKRTPSARAPRARARATSR